MHDITVHHTAACITITKPTCACLCKGRRVPMKGGTHDRRNLSAHLPYTCAPGICKKIGKATYQAKVYFSNTGMRLSTFCRCKVSGPFFSDIFDITKHPQYKCLSYYNYNKKNTFDVERFLSRRLTVKPENTFEPYKLDAPYPFWKAAG